MNEVNFIWLPPGTRSSHHFIPQSASQNWTQTVQWGWFFCGQPWLQNSKSSWYWWHYTIVLHLLRVQFAVVGRFGEQSWRGAWWFRCPIHAPPWTTKNIQLTTRWWELLRPYKKHCLCYTGTYYNHWKNLQNWWWRLWQNGCYICKPSFVNSSWFDAVKTCYDVPYK